VIDISGRFLELGLDDHHSDYGQELQIKQQRFTKEFEKLQGKIFEDNTYSTLQIANSQSTKDHVDSIIEQDDDHDINK
jgi:hypothetical protein